MKFNISDYGRLLPLLFLIIAIVCFFSLGLGKYLSFNSIKEHRDALLHLTKVNYLLSVVIYILVYILIVTFSVPGAVFLTLAGGVLFGVTLGTLYVVLSATIGATFLFLIVRSAFGGWIAMKAGMWINKLAHGFQQDAFNYLLFLRLIPIFPFWIVNIVPALLKVRLITFFLATCIGIIPGSFIYVSVGNSLNSIFDTGKEPNLGIIFTSPILLTLLGLAVLSILPVIYKRYKGKNHE